MRGCVIDAPSLAKTILKIGEDPQMEKVVGWEWGAHFIISMKLLNNMKLTGRKGKCFKKSINFAFLIR